MDNKKYSVYLAWNKELVKSFDYLGEARLFGKNLRKDFYILDDEGYNVTFGFTVKELKNALKGYDDDMEIRVGFGPYSKNIEGITSGDSLDTVYIKETVSEDNDVYRVF